MKLSKQPLVIENSPGNFQIDMTEHKRYAREMKDAKDQWDRLMAGAENDPDEIMNRLFSMFK